MRPSTLSLTSLFCLCATVAAQADVTALCKLDRGTVTVAFTNPAAKTMQCEVNCDMGLPGGFGTVVCVKPVPSGAKDLVMCTEKNSGPAYTSVRGQTVNCRDPEGAPVAPDADKDDDEDSDALIKKIQEQSQEMLRRMQKK